MRRIVRTFAYSLPISLGEVRKRFLVVPTLLLCATFGAAQTQNAVVKRNTYLREGPSSSDKKSSSSSQAMSLS